MQLNVRHIGRLTPFVRRKQTEETDTADQNKTLLVHCISVKEI